MPFISKVKLPNKCFQNKSDLMNIQSKLVNFGDFDNRIEFILGIYELQDKFFIYSTHSNISISGIIKAENFFVEKENDEIVSLKISKNLISENIKIKSLIFSEIELEESSFSNKRFLLTNLVSIDLSMILSYEKFFKFGDELLFISISDEKFESCMKDILLMDEFKHISPIITIIE